jgi:hypothetical protein
MTDYVHVIGNTIVPDPQSPSLKFDERNKAGYVGWIDGHAVNDTTDGWKTNGRVTIGNASYSVEGKINAWTGWYTGVSKAKNLVPHCLFTWWYHSPGSSRLDFAIPNERTAKFTIKKMPERMGDQWIISYDEIF